MPDGTTTFTNDASSSAGVAAIVDKALKLCEPTTGEVARITAVAEGAKALVERQVAGSNEVVGVIFGGSFAKGTWLRGSADVDIFVKVDPSVVTSIERFEEMGKSIGLAALRRHGPVLRYSDHPYVEAFVQGFRVNVVPCYDVEKGRWISAADRSPYHTSYINENYDAEKRRQVRLLKKFFKAAGIYGAEISTGGFSGYVCEVLVLKYGSFEGVLRAAADIKGRGQVVAIDGYDPDVAKGFQSPLIIIDPVDARRNLGTAISPESAGKFILLARSFLSRPSLAFFTEKRGGVGGGVSNSGGSKKGGFSGASAPARELYPNILLAEFAHAKRSPDIIWGQLKRSTNAVAKQLELAGFVVMRSTCVTDEQNSAVLAFLLESMTLPPYAVRRGPEVFRRRDAARFVSSDDDDNNYDSSNNNNSSTGSSKKRKRPVLTWVDRDMRVSMLARRKETDARRLVKSLLDGSVGNSGVAKDLVADRKKLRIYSGSERKINSSKRRGLVKEAVVRLAATESLIFSGHA